MGESECYNNFSIEINFMTADTYPFTDSASLQDISTSVPVKNFFDALSLSFPPAISYPTLTDRDVIVDLPLILPKLKEVEILEGKITDPDVGYSFDTQHPFLTQWFATVAYVNESQVNTSKTCQLSLCPTQT